GTAVSYQVVSTSGGQVLVVLGTGANDVITVSQAADRITLTTSAGSQDVAGSFAGIALYGFGGADTLRLTYSVTAQHAIYGGDGNDQIFDNAQGAGWDYGNAGDDLIVTIGGGADTVWGGAGLVSFWVDSSDAIADATAAEIAAGSIHTISQFYQPYTTDPTAANYVSLNINGQNLADPTASYAYQSFAAKPLFTDGPDYRDIAQGQVGDCYFLAALASIADTHPDIIRQAIAPLGGCLWKPGRIPRSLAVRTTHLCVAPAVQGAGRCLETVHRRAGRPVRGVGGLRDGPCPSCWPRTEVSPGDGLWAADNKIDRRRNRVSWRNGN
ncbi:MAG: C2 family cysteine protease, partial [Phycisphaerae bacterium]